MKVRTLVVCTALAASACTGGGASVSGTTTIPLTTTTMATPVTTTTTALVLTLDWFKTAVFSGVEGSLGMRSVTAGGPGLVAVGSGFADFDDDDAAVWTSADGLTWSRVPYDDSALGGEGFQSMTSVTAGGPGLVAVGYDSLGNSQAAAVWTSPDGITWSRIPHDAAVFGGENFREMKSVTVGGPGLVAVGSDQSGGDEDAAVWTSPDGITWSQVPHDEAVLGGEGVQSMVSVTAGGPGLVAVGREFDSSGRDVVVVWTSADGITWSRVPHDEAVFGGEGELFVSSVTAGGPGLVAVGGEDLGVDSDAAVWTSSDGIIWSRVPHDEEVFGGEDNQFMLSVTAGGPGLVAVGFDRPGPGLGEDAAVWTSPDGITWSRVPHDEVALGGLFDQRMESVTAGGPGLVAVGSEDGRAAVWVGAPEG